jgi:hypothetical protein
MSDESQNVTEPQVNTDGGGTQDGGTPESWTSVFSADDLKGNEAFKGFENADQLGQKYLEVSEKLAGIKQAPETADAYELPTLDGLPYQDTDLNALRDVAHKAGLTQDQMTALMTWHNEYTQNQVKAITEQAQERQTKAMEALKGEWGDDYENRINGAKNALSKLTGDDFKQFLEDTRAGDHPALIKAFDSIARAMKESDILDGGKPNLTKDVQRTPGGTPVLDFSASMPT